MPVSEKSKKSKKSAFDYSSNEEESSNSSELSESEKIDEPISSGDYDNSDDSDNSDNEHIDNIITSKNKNYNENKVNIKRLEKFIEKNIGFENSNDNHDKKAEKKINRQDLIDYFDHPNRITKYADENWHMDSITVNQYVDYMLTEDKSTRGFGYELLPSQYEYFDIELINNIPNLFNLPYNHFMRTKVRDEHYAIDYVIRMTRSDEILSKFPELTTPEFQVQPIKGDERYYDVLFPKLKVALEIQEYNANHDESENDLLKKDLCRKRGFKIDYFKIGEYKEKYEEYLNDFWYGNKEKKIYGFRNLIFDSLLAWNEDEEKVKEIRKELVILNYEKDKQAYLKAIDNEIEEYDSKDKTSSIQDERNEYNKDEKENNEISEQDKRF